MAKSKEERSFKAMISFKIDESGRADIERVFQFVPGIVKGVKFNDHEGYFFDTLPEARDSLHKSIDTIFDMVENGLETGK